MEHDDRTRARNLARLRQPHKDAQPEPQLPCFTSTPHADDLQELCGILARHLDTTLRHLEDILDLNNIPAKQRDPIAQDRAALRLDIAHFRQPRGQAALEIAFRALYASLCSNP